MSQYTFTTDICFVVVFALGVDGIPIIRKIISFGNSSKGVILPKSWLTFLESKHGKIEAVSMEVNGKLTIRPILKEERI